MKHLLTAIACFFALSVSAQEALPWNPNANNDNIIGTVDLLAMLNVYGEEYPVQTCFKGDLCYYVNQGGVGNSSTHESAVGCGTIVAKTYNSSSPQYWLSITINLTNEGYLEGDVLHLVHHYKYNSYGESANFKTYYDNTWNTVVYFTASGTNPFSRASVIFNGEYWEAID